MMRAALGMSAMAMLRVASVESPAWTWGSMDAGEAAMATPLPTDAPAADAHGITLQVAALLSLMSAWTRHSMRSKMSAHLFRRMSSKDPPHLA